VSYTRPVDPTGISSFYAHTRRNPPSQEAGVDYYCSIGTPIIAAGDGRVVAAAGDIYAATGRYLTIDLDDGRRVRYLHLSRWAKSAGDRVRQGAVVGYSGASGYGSEFFGASSMDTFPWGDTGGPHVHTSLFRSWAYEFGSNPTRTLDFEAYVDGNLAGGGSTPLEEDDMFTDQDRADIQAIKLALGAGGLAPGGIKDEDTVLGATRTIRSEVHQISNAVGAGGAVDGLLPDSDTVLGRVRSIDDSAP